VSTLATTNPYTPSEFVLGLPKAELHLHLEGTVDPQTLIELSKRHPTPLPVENNRYAPDPASGDVLDEAKVAKIYGYSDFTGFLMAFKAVTERLRTPEDYELITYAMCRNLARENVLHAEVFVSVGVVLWRGAKFEPLFAGMEAGRKRAEKDFGVSVLWIFDAVRHFGVEEGYSVVNLALKLRDEQIAREATTSVVGFGIGGDERRASAAEFEKLYRHAADHGLRLTAHAGETVGPESIWAAINIGAERIGHGLHAFDDPELIEILAERQVPVEVCMSSNVRTNCCAGIAQHPARRMFDAGLMITLNSDDPAMFQTTVAREYQIAHEVFGFTEDQLREVARNSFEASFLPPEQKLKMLDLCDRS
jgi:adenosine deaminase/aminodeoxyfutalosine deaminase